MATCWNCGDGDADASTRYCTRCGVRLEPPATAPPDGRGSDKAHIAQVRKHAFAIAIAAGVGLLVVGGVTVAMVSQPDPLPSHSRSTTRWTTTRPQPTTTTTTTTTTPITTTVPAAPASTGDCLVLDAFDGHLVRIASCASGWGAYQVARVRYQGDNQDCPSETLARHEGAYLICVRRHLLVKHCYRRPDSGLRNWFAGVNCSTPGSIVVRAIVAPESPCPRSVRWDVRYSYHKPDEALCVTTN